MEKKNPHSIIYLFIYVFVGLVVPVRPVATDQLSGWAKCMGLLKSRLKVSRKYQTILWSLVIVT